MLKQIDDYYKYLMILLLVIYLINSTYLNEVTITFTVIALVIVLELIRSRHYIKRLSYSQLAIIGVVLVASIAAIIYLLVMLQISLEPFNFPQPMETIIVVLFVLIGIYVLWYFMKKFISRALDI